MLQTFVHTSLAVNGSPSGGVNREIFLSAFLNLFSLRAFHRLNSIKSSANAAEDVCRSTKSTLFRRASTRIVCWGEIIR